MTPTDGGFSVIFHYATYEDAERMLKRLRELGASNDCDGHLVDEDEVGGFVLVDDEDGSILSDYAHILRTAAYDEQEAFEEVEVGQGLPTVYALLPPRACYSDVCKEGGEVDHAALDPNLLASVARGEMTIQQAYHMQFGRYLEEEDDVEV